MTRLYPARALAIEECRPVEELRRLLAKRYPERQASCSTCTWFDPPDFSADGRVGNPFGYCSYRQMTREGADVPCSAHEPLRDYGVDHGDVGAARQGETR